MVFDSDTLVRLNNAAVLLWMLILTPHTIVLHASTSTLAHAL